MDNAMFFVFNTCIDYSDIDDALEMYYHRCGERFNDDIFNSNMINILKEVDPEQQFHSLYSVKNIFKCYVILENSLIPQPKVDIEKYKNDMIARVLSSDHDPYEAIQLIELIMFTKYDTKILRHW